MSASHNLLLDHLPTETMELLRPYLRPVSLPKKTTLYENSEVPRYAHFLTSGISSVVVETHDGDTAEVNILGNEALVESLHLLGPTRVPTRAYMQVEGTALRMRFDDLLKCFHQFEDLRKLILRFVQNQSSLTSQIAACNRLHSAEERLARWLLMVQDRTQGGELSLTQEFLAVMLGARRSTVALAAGALQNSGLIRYRRGQVQIIDRDNLQRAACDCYPILKDLLEGLYREV